MSLRAALLVSLLLHAAATGAVAGVLGWISMLEREAPRPEAGRELVLNLVDPVTHRPESFADEEAAAPIGANPIRNAVPGAEAEGYSAASGDSGGAGGRIRRRLSDKPTVAELEEALGLELDGMPEQYVNRLFPVMLKYHYQGERPNASTYRQLLRSYIDGHMGYPHAVTDRLVTNRDIRFLAWLEVQVESDGRFRIDVLVMNEDVQDPDGILYGYYRRVLDDAAGMPFIPPMEAGLPAPHRLAFQLLNPENRF